MLRLVAPLATSALLVSSCAIGIPGSHLRVDGVDLEEQHEESLEIGGWHADGLALESNIGDVRIRPTSGPTTIIATVHETRLGDARMRYDNGELITTTESGDPAAFGDVLILTNGPLPSARVSSGMGDLIVQGVQFDGDLKLETGMGDVIVNGVRVGGKAGFATGMGDISVHDLRCARVSADSGMGDIELEQVEADEADFDSGLGDIELTSCTFGRLDAETGLGDIECADTSYERGHLDTGLGSIADENR